jgi:AraC family transcriptional regulator
MICLTAGRFFGETVITRRFGAFTITYSRYRPGERLPRHCHEHAYLYVMLGGGISERALRRDNVCTRGWVVYNEAGEAHQDQVLERGAEGLNIEVDAAWLATLRETRALHEAVCYRHVGPAITAVGGLQVAMQSTDLLQQLRVEEAVTQLINSLCGTPESRRRLPPAWLSRIEELIRSRPCSQLFLQELAAAAGVHPAHLCREFRRAFGCTMSQYLVRWRADAALQKLMRSEAPLTTVAAATGFADQAHLTRTIRSQFGTTPGGLRRRQS